MVEWMDQTNVPQLFVGAKDGAPVILVCISTERTDFLVIQDVTP